MRKEIKRLCRSLFYIAALHLCPSVRRRRAGEAAADGRQACTSLDKGASGAVSVFGKVIGNLPLGMGLTAGSGAFEYCSEDAPDFGVLCRQRPGPTRVRVKDADSPRKTGLEILRATLNLARGDLEQKAGPCCV